MKESNDSHYGLPVLKLCGEEYAVAINDASANQAAIACLKDEYWIYHPNAVQELLKLPDWIFEHFKNHDEGAIAQFFNLTTVGELFALNFIAKNGRGTLSPGNRKEMRFDDLRADRQELMLQLAAKMARNAYYYPLTEKQVVGYVADGICYHLECFGIRFQKKYDPKDDSVCEIYKGDRDFAYSSIPVCQHCKGKIPTIEDEIMD